MRDLVVFLDDGGVMNDNSVRGPQWQRLIGEYLIPRLGGEAASWAAANVVVVERQVESFGALSVHDDFNAFMRLQDESWLREMCELQGIQPPSTFEERLALARATQAYVLPRVRSAFPEVVEAIRELYDEGYALNTASGELSTDLDAYLTAMEVRPCFGRLYGTDLINTAKSGSLYYERILRNAGVSPSEAIFVDDSPRCVAWAREIGARAVLMARNGEDDATFPVVRSLTGLPVLLRSL
jgi:HAD superfamily hydrolase (TIGR01509 family)